MHARYAVGDKVVWHAPGYDQVILADGDEFFRLPDLRQKKVRKDINKLWDHPNSITLNNNFDNLVKKYVEVILKGKEACDNINSYLNRKNDSL